MDTMIQMGKVYVMGRAKRHYPGAWFPLKKPLGIDALANDYLDSAQRTMRMDIPANMTIPMINGRTVPL